MADTSAISNSSSLSKGSTLSTLGSAGNASNSLAEDLDSFLTLLVAQLQNQDPLDPMDSSEFTNQLVQFANVEQNIATNSNLENLLLIENNNLAIQAVNYLDQTIQASSVYMPLQESYGKFSYTLLDDATSCTITIADGATGTVVSSIKGDVTAGRHILDWDGTDAQGNVHPDGAYRITVAATDVNGDLVDSYTTVFGKVTGVANDGSEVAVALGDVVVYTSDILAVHQDDELAPPSTDTDTDTDVKPEGPDTDVDGSIGGTTGDKDEETEEDKDGIIDALAS